MEPLLAVSPIDGRYRNKTECLEKYFSEFGLIKYRLYVEVEYFIALCELPLPQLKNVDKKVFANLRKIASDFSVNDAKRIKKIEATTNHDVKAVEYFLKEKFEETGLSEFKEFIHFGLTSQDVNNTAVPISIKQALENVLLPVYEELLENMKQKADEWKDISMLARTHGQPASPTRLGKEVNVFIYRLEKQLDLLKAIPHTGKFGGATGNFNAHNVAYKEIDWVKFGEEFLKGIGLERQKITTQIDNYDMCAAQFDTMKRINTILIDFSRDIWTYVSFDYFKQKIKKGEVGSSAMPHKVNPIDFENAEGNLGIANAIFSHLAGKMPISRLQRDLTDSTVSRNIGVPFSHSLISLKSIIKGLGKLKVNKEKIDIDLENNIVVVAEAIQTILRREGVENPYEKLKDLTRSNKKLTKFDIDNFIEDLEIESKLKKELKQITAFNYTGI